MAILLHLTVVFLKNILKVLVTMAMGSSLIKLCLQVQSLFTNWNNHDLEIYYSVKMGRVKAKRKTNVLKMEVFDRLKVPI